MPLNLYLLKLVLACEAAFAVELADCVITDSREADVMRVEQKYVRRDYIHRLDVCMIRKNATL